MRSRSPSLARSLSQQDNSWRNACAAQGYPNENTRSTRGSALWHPCGACSVVCRSGGDWLSHRTPAVHLRHLRRHTASCSMVRAAEGAASNVSITGINGVAPPSLGAGILGVAISPTATAAAGITPVVSASLEASHVLKNAPGNLYSVFASNLTGGTVGNLQIFNATSAPSDGAVTPLVCVPFDAGGKAMAFYSPGPPAVFSTGIVAVISSAASCFTKTTGVLTGFISGMTQ